MKRIIPILAICLTAATAAHAQSGGGRRGGGGGGQGAPPTSSTPASTTTPSAKRSKAPGKIEIVGVIQAIDPQAGRVTIAYEATDALNWPAGVMAFVVSKSALLKDATVGEKVRFSLESEQISDLKPF